MDVRTNLFVMKDDTCTYYPPPDIVSSIYFKKKPTLGKFPLPPFMISILYIDVCIKPWKPWKMEGLVYSPEN